MPSDGLRPGEEGRSHFVSGNAEPLAPSTTDPCAAPPRTHWVHAFSPSERKSDPLLVGKWLIYISCQHVVYCWSRVRDATEGATLGVSAKISTDWGKAHDPAGMSAEGLGGWRDHVICVYTADWRDRDDVARVGSRLAEIDAVRTQSLRYKPDIFTYEGRWAGISPGEVAIYSMKPPYDDLLENSAALAALRGNDDA
jgi:hypothetical protein